MQQRLTCRTARHALRRQAAVGQVEHVKLRCVLADHVLDVTDQISRRLLNLSGGDGRRHTRIGGRHGGGPIEDVVVAAKDEHHVVVAVERVVAGRVEVGELLLDRIRERPGATVVADTVRVGHARTALRVVEATRFWAVLHRVGITHDGRRKGHTELRRHRFRPDRARVGSELAAAHGSRCRRVGAGIAQAVAEHHHALHFGDVGIAALIAFAAASGQAQGQGRRCDDAHPLTELHDVCLPCGIFMVCGAAVRNLAVRV